MDGPILQLWSKSSQSFLLNSLAKSAKIAIAVTVTGIMSILHIRRFLFETFLKLRLVTGVGIIVCLWLQVTEVSGFHAICLFVATGLWSFEKLIWLGRVAFDRVCNLDQANISPSQGHTSSSITTIQIRSQRHRKITHGQYIFIAIPTIPRAILGRLQAPPYLVAWEHKDDSSQILTLLVAHRAGFGKMIQLCKSDARIRVDGPYGGTKSLKQFDKVLFVASGIGVAAHLLAIRHLVQLP